MRRTIIWPTSYNHASRNSARLFFLRAEYPGSLRAEANCSTSPTPYSYECRASCASPAPGKDPGYLPREKARQIPGGVLA